MKKLSIVIPCYNESKNIPLIFKRFNEAIKKSSLKSDELEVILVDNGSSEQ